MKFIELHNYFTVSFLLQMIELVLKLRGVCGRARHIFWDVYNLTVGQHQFDNCTVTTELFGFFKAVKIYVGDWEFTLF